MENTGSTKKRRLRKHRLQRWGNRGDTFRSRRRKIQIKEKKKVETAAGERKGGSKVKSYMKVKNISKYFPAMTA